MLILVMATCVICVTAAVFALSGTAYGIDESASAPAGAAPAGAQADAQGLVDPLVDAAPIDEPDGVYTVEVVLEGGTGKATVASPADLEVVDGRAVVTLVWSSRFYDYMVVSGKKYLPVNESGDSTFVVPVTVFDEAVPVIGDTTAMSEAHEVNYTLTVLRDTVKEKTDEPPEESASDAKGTSALPWPWAVFIVCAIASVACIGATVVLLRRYRRS